MPEMKTVNVRLILTKFLQENGYDGLFNSESLCCCRVSNLMLHDEGGCAIVNDCQPGFISIDPSDPNDWVICKEKEKEKGQRQ